MTYNIEAWHQGAKEKEYPGIESNTSSEAIDRIILEHYNHIALEYNNQLVVIGYEFIARRLEMWLS